MWENPSSPRRNISTKLRIQVLQAAAQLVYRPRHDHVEFASRGITTQLVERWPLVAAFGAADAVILVTPETIA
jgi:hypothetical protein